MRGNVGRKGGRGTGGILSDCFERQLTLFMTILDVIGMFTSSEISVPENRLSFMLALPTHTC